jgi:hypothetical protein
MVSDAADRHALLATQEPLPSKVGIAKYQHERPPGHPYEPHSPASAPKNEDEWHYQEQVHEALLAATSPGVLCPWMSSGASKPVTLPAAARCAAATRATERPSGDGPHRNN